VLQKVTVSLWTMWSRKGDKNWVQQGGILVGMVLWTEIQRWGLR
jgi:hypothetical protein